jgi:hypothetical protein
MRRACVVLFSCLAVAGTAVPAASQTYYPPTAHQPAATLLLPYFEVGLGAAGSNTLFSVNNASAAAALTHVTIWSDLGVPVMGFDLYLTGYDVQWINLRDVLLGKLPRTATSGQDPTDTISPQGPISQDINFANCTGLLPPPTILDAATRAHVKAWLTGRMSPTTGNCAGTLKDKNVARGYVTVDVVYKCSTMTPADAGYFIADGTGVAGYINLIWGDYYQVGGTLRADSAEPLVHIRVDRNDPETTTAGQYTFYGRFVNWSAEDRREPLSTMFAARFFNGVGLSAAPTDTDFIVWRDPKTATAEPFACGSAPAWYPLPEEDLVGFDEQEEPVDIAANTFPAAANRVRVKALPVPVAGWLFINLNAAVTQAGANPPEDPAAAQGWVTTIHRRTILPYKYTVGVGALPMDSAKKVLHLILPL